MQMQIIRLLADTTSHQIDDLTRNLGPTIAAVVIILVVVFAYLRSTKKSEMEGAPTIGVTNGAPSGARDVNYWNLQIKGICDDSIEQNVVPKLDDLLREVRAIKDIANEIRVRMRP